MQVDLLEVMCGMFRANGIQVILHTGQEEATAIDYGFRSKIFPDYTYDSLAHQIERLITPGTLYQFQDDLYLHYSIYCFSDKAVSRAGNQDCTNTQKQYLVIGPVLFQPISAGQFRILMERLKLPKKLESDVMEFFNRIPIAPPFDNWNNILIYFLSQLNQGPLEYRFITDNHLGLFHASYTDYQIASESDMALETIEQRYLYETEIINAVSAGNLEQAIKAHHQFMQFKVLPRTPDSLRNQKNLSIVLNTLLRKAVQSGAVHPLHIDNLSRQFAIQIESASSCSQLDALSSTMIRKYCMLVKNFSRKSYSSLVRTCMNYIDFYYTEDLSLTSLAELCSLSSSYLSASFKKETGMTLTDYINNTRISQSLILLNTTSLSIQEIASRCGFSDSNYYTRTFKRLQGISPKGYRESIRR